MAFDNNRSGRYGQSRSSGNFGGNDRGTPPEASATLISDDIRLGTEINPKLYSDIAENAAIEVGKQIGGRDANKGTQLRRFYDELVMLQGKVGNSPEKFSAQAPYIQMLKAKVAYAMGRKKVDANFDKLIRHLVDEVKDPVTFAQAKLFMEAFMAFYKVHGPKD